MAYRIREMMLAEGDDVKFVVQLPDGSNKAYFPKKRFIFCDERQVREFVREILVSDRNLFTSSGYPYDFSMSFGHAPGKASVELRRRHIDHADSAESLKFIRDTAQVDLRLIKYGSTSTKTRYYWPDKKNSSEWKANPSKHRTNKYLEFDGEYRMPVFAPVAHPTSTKFLKQGDEWMPTTYSRSLFMERFHSLFLEDIRCLLVGRSTLVAVWK